jgi:ATP-dependent helicase/nuclease subunit B
MPVLREYKGTKADSALTSMMLSLIDELHANGISAKMCEDVSERCDKAELSSKLSDIAAIYENFERNIESRLGESALSSENKLSRLGSLLRKCDCFSDCHFFIDSFTSFTGEEHDVLESLILNAENVTISFTY